MKSTIEIHADIIVEFLNQRGFDVYYCPHTERIYLKGYGDGLLVYFDIYPEDWAVVDPYFWEDILFTRLQLHFKDCDWCKTRNKCPYKQVRKYEKFTVIQQAEAACLIEKNKFVTWKEIEL